MRIRIMFLDLHVAFVVEKAVKHESRIAVGAFDGHAVEGGVIIREEGIEFESEVGPNIVCVASSSWAVD